MARVIKRLLIYQMKQLKYSLFLVGGFVLSGLSGWTAAQWEYEGSRGPDKWGSLDPANSACNIGREQSPNCH